LGVHKTTILTTSAADTNPRDEQDLYLRNFMLGWMMQNKAALKLPLLTQPLPPLFTIQHSFGLGTHSTSLDQSPQNVTGRTAEDCQRGRREGKYSVSSRLEQRVTGQALAARRLALH